MADRMASASTRGIRVAVTSQFLPQHSSASARRFAFSYTVQISNDSNETVQLRSRHWHILHGNGRREEVRGPGVVGEQPVLRPGEDFEYSSGCVLTAPHGTMHGTYEMVSGDGVRFEVEIPAFSLSTPHALN
jgi:ApaG protein